MEPRSDSATLTAIVLMRFIEAAGGKIEIPMHEFNNYLHTRFDAGMSIDVQLPCWEQGADQRYVLTLVNDR